MACVWGLGSANRTPNVLCVSIFLNAIQTTVGGPFIQRSSWILKPEPAKKSQIRPALPLLDLKHSSCTPFSSKAG